MFQSITIEGLGPHESFATDLAADGVTTVMGRSQSGKSTLLAALCFVLWGTGTDGKPFDVAGINDDCDAADVTVTTAEGVKLRRRITGKRSTSLYVNGERVASGVFTEAIGKLAHLAAADKSTELTARLVLVPGAWHALASSAGGGRALRDVLASVTPGSLRDEVERLMTEAGHTLDKGDIIDIKAAEKLRRAANSDADRSRGRAEEAASNAAALAEGRPELVPAADVEEAERITINAGVWRDFDAAQHRHDVAKRSAESANTAAAEWQRRIDALGPAPVVDHEALQAARDAVTSQEAEVQRITDSGRSVRNLIDVAEEGLRKDLAAVDANVARLAAAHTAATELLAKLEDAGDTCPTCNRPGWEHAQQGIEKQRETVATTKAALASAEQGRDAAIATVKAEHEADTAEHVSKRERLLSELTEARAELERRKQARADAEKGSDALSVWHAKKASYGDKPTTVAVDPAPARPGVERPDDESIHAARETLDRAKRATIEAESFDKRLAEAEARSAKAGEQAAEDKARAEWAAALVDAIRRAPGEQLRRGLDALGDLGPVTIEVPEEGAAIRVLLDGREWHHASSGRRVLGDLYLRLALRRAFGLGELPVFVDDVGRWSGEWPKSTAPSVWLITAARDLTVTVKGARTVAGAA